ncbi:MAG TPA: tetratricopeptide repeat protein, partial [Isosphaeraceae bacterium]|nr:tetratricopeptide repeat protein [Isosphaeraceae bacterium]
IERASVYHRQGQYAKALADLDRAIALEPVWTLLVYRALIQEESGDLNAALSDLDRAIDLEPKAGPAYFARALLKTKLGEVDTSARDFEKFAEMGSPGVIAGAGPIETVVKAIRENQQGGRAAMHDAQVRRAALNPGETRR